MELKANRVDMENNPLFKNLKFNDLKEYVKYS